jgi:hypothetical protein
MSHDPKKPNDHDIPPPGRPGRERSFVEILGTIVVVLVGLALLLIPGGCALGGIYMSVASLAAGAKIEPGAVLFALAFVVINGALAYGGYRLIRNEMK